MGLIGDLSNLPGLRSGVPLGPILRHRFNLPVFISATTATCTPTAFALNQLDGPITPL